MAQAFAFADHLGPEKVIEIYDPAAGLRAILVVDNVAMGPAIGGVRMAPDADVAECFRLARAMTLKNSAAGLPHGGGKSVIVSDSKIPTKEKECLVRSFASAIEEIRDYIPGPDLGTNETAMAWVKDAIGRAVGLPRELGGIPLDEIGATGFGLSVALQAAEEFSGVRVDGSSVAIQGFGAVGQHAARFLAANGARLVAASDSQGCCYDPKGIDVQSLTTFKQGGRSVADYPAAQSMDPDALLDVECDIWIPAARPDVLRADNVGRLRASVVAEGANIPTTLDAERLLEERGVLVLPDFIANAGGVVCAAMELARATESQAMKVVEERIRANVREMLAISRSEKKTPREAATEMAQARVQKAMSFRKTS